MSTTSGAVKAAGGTPKGGKRPAPQADATPAEKKQKVENKPEKKDRPLSKDQKKAAFLKRMVEARRVGMLVDGVEYYDPEKIPVEERPEKFVAVEGEVALTKWEDTKEMRIDAVNPFSEEQTDAMFSMDAEPVAFACSNIPGMNVRIICIIAVTFRRNAKSQSSSVTSSMVPL